MKSGTTSTGLSVQEMASIERFLISCSVPLIYQGNEQIGVIGTGTFYEHDGQPFLVTAGHVVDRIDPNKLGVPERAGKDVHVVHFEAARIHHPRNTDEFDVAVIELQDEGFVSAARAGWHFLSAANVAEPNASPKQYIVAGYPDTTVKNVDGVLTPSALTQLYTSPYEGEVEGVSGPFDIFLRYGRDAANTYGARKATPELGGMSGGAAYAVLEPTLSFWAPESILKIVGIQVSFLHSKYVRIKRWSLVSQIFSLISSTKN